MNCERCNRDINHKGRCLPCNYLYKHKAFFSGLRISDEYDLSHNMDLGLVHKLVKEKEYKPESKFEYEIKPRPEIIGITNLKPIIEPRPRKYVNCLRCNCSLNQKRLYCVDCFRFIKSAIGKSNKTGE